MIKEIYAKDPADPNFQENIIEHSDVYESVLQKVRMILYTKPGEVLGDPTFGINLEEYIFSFNASNKKIKEEVEKQIRKYIPEALVMDISVSVKFKKGKIKDICYIDIIIDGTNAMGLIIN